MIQGEAHDWSPISVGEYDTLYQCQICGTKHMESVDDITSGRPLLGCIPDVPHAGEVPEEDEG